MPRIIAVVLDLLTIAPERLKIEPDSMATVLGYHERINRCAPVVDSCAGPKEEKRFVAGSTIAPGQRVSLGYFRWEPKSTKTNSTGVPLC